MKHTCTKLLLFLIFFVITVLFANAQTSPKSPDYAIRFGAGTGATYGQAVWGLCLDNNGNTYATGDFNKTTNFNPSGTAINYTAYSNSADGYVAKYNSSGIAQWVIPFTSQTGSTATTNSNYGLGVAVDATGNVYVAGSFYGTVDFNPSSTVSNTLTANGNSDIFIAKYNSNGQYQWAYNMGGSSYDLGSKLELDASGNIYLTGLFQSNSFQANTTGSGTLVTLTNTSSATTYDIFIMKFTTNGTFQNAISFGSSAGNDEVNAIKLDKNNNLLVGGKFLTSMTIGSFTAAAVGRWDDFVAKFDNNLNPLFLISFGGKFDETFGGLAVDDNNDIIIVGTLNGLAGTRVDMNPSPTQSDSVTIAINSSAELVIAKYDNNGNYKWAKTATGSANHITRPMGIDIDSCNNIIVGGAFTGTIDFDPSSASGSFTSASNWGGAVAKFSTEGNYMWGFMTSAFSVSIYAMAYNKIIGKYAIGGDMLTNTTYPNADFDPTSGTKNLSSLNTTYANAFIAVYPDPGNVIPTITLGSVSNILTTATSFNIPYSATTANPNQYSITAGSTTIMSGFNPVNNATLGSSPINVSIPPSAANTYNFNLTVKNSASGCVSANYPLTVKITSPCTSSTSTYTQTACDSFYWAAKSKWYYANNTTDTVKLVNAAGCDSVVTLNLTINTAPVINSITSGNVCTGSPITINVDTTATQVQWQLNGITVSTNNNLTTTPAATSGTTVAGGNGQGSAANQFNVPRFVYVDAAKNVYIADRNNHRVQKWVPGATSGITVAGGNGQGSAANQFNQPTGLFVDTAGNIYVADFFNHRIQKWTPGATSGITVAGGNGAGTAANQLITPVEVFVNAVGEMYISQSNGQSVKKWALGATSGTIVAGGSGQGSAANQLNQPAGVYLDVMGNVYIADQGNHRIQKWAPGAVTGVTVAGGNGQGSTANQLSAPAGVFVDESGNIFVVDRDNYRIQKWTAGAASGVTVAGGNGLGAAANQLNTPTGIFVDPAGNMYIADNGNSRIQKWLGISKTASYTPTQAGNYTAIVSNGGCSITSSVVVVNAPTTSTYTQTACDSFYWAAKSKWYYTNNNTDTIKLVNAAGCDSIVALNLTIKTATSSIFTVSACGSYTWVAKGNKVYTASNNTDTIKLVNAAGCDSVVTLNLTINTGTFSATTQTACNSYTWSANGQTYTASGTYVRNYNNANGCASADTLYLTINTGTFNVTTQTACNSYTWSANGQTYTASGTYVRNYNNANGCASADTLHLTINTGTFNATTQTACNSYTWSANGQTYTASGTYVRNYNNANGCASADTLYLTINTGTFSATTQSACNSYTWSANGQTYTASGSYIRNYNNANGCASADTLHLTINTGTFNVTTQTACNSYTWNGRTYTSSTVDTFSYTNSNGCASVDTLYLTINSSTHNVITTSSCDSFYWSNKDKWYYSSTIDTFGYINSNGCASVDTLKITINNAPATPSITTSTLNVAVPVTGVTYSCTTVANAFTYFWSYTGTGATITNGQGTTTITVDFAANATNGIMQVIAVSSNGCNSKVDTVSIVLPISITNFTVSKVNNTALLNWSSTLEVNAKEYQVLRSTDGRTFEPIGIVAAKGVASEYKFTDMNLPLTANTIHYKLKLVDKDGKYSYSENRLIKLSNTQFVTVYPNPAHSIINIKIGKLIGTGSIVVTDLYGKQLKQQPLSMGINTIDVSHLAKGMYMVTTITEQSKQTEKVFVE